MAGFSRVLTVTLILCSCYFLIVSLFENLKVLLKMLSVVKREGRRMAVVLPGQNDKQHITHGSFCVFFARTTPSHLKKLMLKKTTRCFGGIGVFVALHDEL